MRNNSYWLAAMAAMVMGLGMAAGARGDTILNLGVPNGTVGETMAVVPSGSIGAGLYYQGTQQPAGSGVLDSFLRVQGANGNSTFEHGYNTDNGTPLDDKPGAFTRDLPFSELQKSSINGVDYYGFVLDINQTKSGAPDPYISLVGLKIFQSTTGNRNDLNTTTLSFPGASLVYDMNASGKNRVDLNYALDSGGSGKADMFLYVPAALFTNQPYVYMYSAFGGSGAYPPYFQDAAYEEWAVAGRGVLVPLPQAAWLGIVLIGGVVGARKLRTRRNGQLA